MARQETAKTIINWAAPELGLPRATDPFASTDDNMVQLCALLNGAGQELVNYNDWQVLRGIYTQTVDLGTNATGIYDLPDDFGYLLNQTPWDKTNDVQVGGPLDAQEWAALDGQDLVTSSIYVSMRLVNNKLYLWPTPPPDGLNVRLEYISRNWATDSTGTVPKDYVTESNDIVLLNPVLMKLFLKMKFKDLKGLDTTKAALDFETMFLSLTGKDQGATVLNAAGSRSLGISYLNALNAPDTGYGSA
jgi:hypothetical protein